MLKIHILVALPGIAQNTPEKQTYLKVLIRYSSKELLVYYSNFQQKRMNHFQTITQDYKYSVKHSGLSSLNTSTEKALTSLFISRLQSKLGSSLIQRHTLGWEAAPLAELAEYFEKTLQQGKKFKANRQLNLHIHISSQNQRASTQEYCA